MISNRAIAHAREIILPHTTRPVGVLLFTDPLYPNNSVDYKVSLTTTQIGIYTSGQDPFMVDYVGKTIKQVAAELSNSPFPIEVKSLVDISYLQEGELLTSGTTIPSSFSLIDRSIDGKGAIIRARRWSISYNKQTTVEVKAPYNTGSVQPWYARISNGSFSKIENATLYYFGVPEYKNQAWSTRFGYPFVDVEGERVNLVGDKKIRTNRSPIYWKGNNIVITDISGSRVYPSTIIKDVDTINGIIYLTDGARVGSNALIHYTYKEDNLIYRGVNLNAHFSQNPQILDMYVVYYALPIKSTAGGEREKGIYHSIGNSIPEAINNITDVSMAEAIAILGAIHVTSNLGYEESNIIDTRSYGGGLTEDRVGKLAEKRFPQTQYFNDLSTYDGIPYHGSAAVVVELPKEITNVMSLEDLKRATKKFIAAGVYVIMDYENISNIWYPTERTPDISQVSFGLRRRAEPERRNYLDFTTTWYDSGDAIAAGFGSSWAYQYQVKLAVRGNPLYYTLYNDVERSDGQVPTWKLWIQSGQGGGLDAYHVMWGYVRKDWGYPYNWETEHSFGHDTPYYDPLVIGYATDYNTISVEVKEPETDAAEYFSISMEVRGTTGTPTIVKKDFWGACFKWVNGVPVWNNSLAAGALNKNLPSGSSFVKYVRDGWYRCGITVHLTGSDLDYFSGDYRQLFLRPNDPGSVGPVLPGIGDFGKGTYFARPQVQDTPNFTYYQEIPGMWDVTLKDDDPRKDSFHTLLDKQVGPTGTAPGWINSRLRLPNDITTGYNALTYDCTPDVKNNHIHIEPGQTYYVKYLRSSPHANFSWEELNNEGKWVSKTHIDKRDVPANTIAAGKITFSSRAEKEIRNFSGIAPFKANTIDSLIDKIIPEVHQIYLDLSALSLTGTSYQVATGVVSNISDGTISLPNVGTTTELLTDLSYKQFLLNTYNIGSMVANYKSVALSTNPLAVGRALLFASGVLYTSDYPRRYDWNTKTLIPHINTPYDFMDELYTYSKYTQDVINEYVYGRYYPTSTAPTEADPLLAVVQSGIFALATQFEEDTTAPGGWDIGGQIRSPFFRASSTTEYPLSGDYAETAEDISNMYLSTDYVRAYAKLYTAQDRHTNAEFANATSIQYNISPLNIAVSGINSAIHHFERYYFAPRFSGEYKTLNWLYTYNRHGKLAGRFVRNITSAIDDIYFGNGEWAGWYGEKGGGYAGPPQQFEDTRFSGQFSRPEGGSVVLSGHFPLMISGYKQILDEMRPLVEANMQFGGITTPEMVDLIRGYLWIPRRAARNYPYFVDAFNQDDIDTFELGMTSLLKGSFTEDGQFFESTSFKHEPVGQPYFPVEVFKGAVDAVEYYRQIDDSYNEARWIAILDGMWNTATGLYKNTYGYPTMLTFDNSGDSGSKLLEAALPILSLKPDQYTSGDLFTLTGGMSSRI